MKLYEVDLGPKILLVQTEKQKKSRFRGNSLVAEHKLRW